MPRKKRSQIAELAKRVLATKVPISDPGGFRYPLGTRRTRKEFGMKSWIMLLAIVSAVGIAGAQSEEGVANFYGDKFQGKKTASGDVFDKDALTAAHKKLPFGTKVKVTNVENGKTIIVTVNDRMAASNPAVIDVTFRRRGRLYGMKPWPHAHRRRRPPQAVTTSAS
jgi:rare lipoprotein A